MIVPFLVLMAAPPAAELWVERPVALPLVIATPSETRGPVSIQDVREALEAAVSAEIFCQLHQIDAEVLRTCAGSVGCVLAHRDTVHAAEDKFPARTGQYLLWLNSVATERAVSISGFLFDLERAKALGTPGSVTDSSLIEGATEFLAAAQLVRDRGELRVYLDQLVRDQLKPVFARLGAGQRLGSIAVSNTPSEADVVLNGRPLGTLIEGNGRIRGVPPGTVDLEFRSFERVPFQATVTVTPEEVVVEPVLPVPGSVMARSLTFWGGVAVLAAGIAVTSAGGLTTSGGERLNCLGGRPGDCWLSPASIPLGMGLMGAGVGAAGTELAIGEWDDWPWPAWIAAAALGVGAGVVTGVIR